MNVIDCTHSKPNQFKSIFHLYEIPINLLSKKHTQKKDIVKVWFPNIFILYYMPTVCSTSKIG